MTALLAIARAAIWVFFILPVVWQCLRGGHVIAAAVAAVLLGALAHKATSLDG